MEHTLGADPTPIEASEVDEPPGDPQTYTTSKEDTVPASDASVTHGLDTIAQQDVILGRAETSVQQSPPLPKRPALRRDSSTPAHDNASIDGEGTQEMIMGGPAYTDQDDREPDMPQDSLSLGQLKKLLQDMPKAEPTSYAFEYTDAASFEEELEELFDYSAEERQHLLKSQRTFAETWTAFKSSTAASSAAYEDGQIDWQSEDTTSKISFLHRLRERLLGDDASDRIVALQCAVYIALGCWLESAASRGLEGRDSDIDSTEDEPYVHAKAQVSAIYSNVELISDAIGVDTIYETLQGACEEDDEEEEGEEDDADDDLAKALEPKSERQHGQHYDERWACLVLLYLVVDLGRRKSREQSDSSLREKTLQLQPELLGFLLSLLVRSRWDDGEHLPQEKLLSLCWKTMLLSFGGIAEVGEIQKALKAANGSTHSEDGPLITASPLDYHLFRQEIISKYPAYNPPPPLFPFEPDSNSMVPSFSESSTRSNSISAATGEIGTANISSTTTSIMQQPIHIATPAPSPPPSPAGPGGKGIKKQNYQTNQMFPFLYPPLDQSSNDLGGKGTTELQDLLAGRKWHGSDIPASILEAADLFSKRMKATRAMKQLWQVRVDFLRFERGQDDIEDLDSYENHTEAMGKSAIDPDDGPLKALDADQRQRLEAVDKFYDENLPHLQSVVIVLLKVLLQAVTTLISQPQGVNGLPNGDPGAEENGQPKAAPASAEETGEDTDDPSLADLGKLRAEEISGKAVAGIFILLLKWFKTSHVLKFEYLSQLLLDSNYIQLILKLFTHQEPERSVAFRCERKDLNFFTWCQAQAQPPGFQPVRAFTNSTSATSNSIHSEEPEPLDAEPPPIRLARQTKSPEPIDPPTGFDPEERLSKHHPPAVDELGFPLTALPSQPITHYSWRTFFTLISHLRILQKLIKYHPHRQLLMVSLKTTMILKRLLRIPHDTLRLYTLKVIKGQVPYCHRKWRAGNMKIITGIYLNVKPGLRDDWLTGGGPGPGIGPGQGMNGLGPDVEESVEGALMGERAWRGLTAWWHAMEYPEQMGLENEEKEAGPEEFNIDLDGLGLKEEDGEVVEGNEDYEPDAGAAFANSTAVEEQPKRSANLKEQTRAPYAHVADSTTATEPPPSPRDISQSRGFNVEYDPFAAVSDSTASSSDPAPLPASAFLSSSKDRASRSSSVASSTSRFSHRTSAASALHDPARDDFFLTELSRMGVIGRAPATNGAHPTANSRPAPYPTSAPDTSLSTTAPTGRIVHPAPPPHPRQQKKHKVVIHSHPSLEPNPPLSFQTTRHESSSADSANDVLTSRAYPGPGESASVPDTSSVGADGREESASGSGPERTTPQTLVIQPFHAYSPVRDAAAPNANDRGAMDVPTAEQTHPPEATEQQDETTGSGLPTEIEAEAHDGGVRALGTSDHLSVVREAPGQRSDGDKQAYIGLQEAEMDKAEALMERQREMETRRVRDEAMGFGVGEAGEDRGGGGDGEDDGDGEVEEE